MKIYKICYLDGCERPYEAFDETDIVADTGLVQFVNHLVNEGRVCEETVSEWQDSHCGNLPATEDEAVEFLESDGYDVRKEEVLYC